MAADPDPPGESGDGAADAHPVDPADLTGVDDADLAALVADAWAADGYRTTVKEHGSHVFVFAKRRVDGEVRGEIVWVAGERAVDSAQLGQLDALAGKTGADSAVCLSVGAGGVAESAAAAHDVSVRSGDDLRAKLGVAVPESDGSSLDSADGPADSSGLSEPGDDAAPAADDGLAPPGGDESVGDGAGGSATGEVGSAGAVDPEGDPGTGIDGEARTTERRHVDAWDGRTTESDVRGQPFDGLWAAVTRGDAVETVADLSVWDGTAR